MPAVIRRIVLVLFAAIFAPILMAGSCSDDDGDSPSATESEDVPEVEVLPVDSGEPDPDLNVDGLELDGPMAPQEGDGSTPDEPSFDPQETESDEPVPEDE